MMQLQAVVLAAPLPRRIHKRAARRVPLEHLSSNRSRNVSPSRPRRSWFARFAPFIGFAGFAGFMQGCLSFLSHPARASLPKTSLLQIGNQQAHGSQMDLLESALAM